MSVTGQARDVCHWTSQRCLSLDQPEMSATGPARDVCHWTGQRVHLAQFRLNSDKYQTSFPTSHTVVHLEEITLFKLFGKMRRTFLVLICLIFCVARCAATEEILTANSSTDHIWNNFRLPKTLKPDSYRLNLYPNIANSTFSGLVVIVLVVVQPTDKIIFHVKDLTIHSDIRISRISARQYTASSSGYIHKYEMYYLKYDTVFRVNTSFSLYVRFNGTFSKDVFGLYKSTYRHNGEEKYIISTQLQPTHARKVFPCLDEPEFKAYFQFETLEADRNDVVLTNRERMHETEGTDCSNCVRHRFRASPYRMSSYLVAFAIGQLGCLTRDSENENRVSIWFPLGREDDAQFALDANIKAVDFFEDFFRMQTRINKLDALAVPRHYSAMENVGLNIYADVYLLYNNQTTNEEWKTLITEIISHEVAHEWFGNMVTLKWWDEIYINEGFATYLSVIGMRAIDSSIDEDAYMGKFHANSLRIASWQTSSAIKKAVENTMDIQQVFDHISYHMTASCIRMLESAIGRHAMRNGLQKLINDKMFGSVTGSDVWNALQSATDGSINIQQMMGSWTDSAGYPVVKVNRTAQNISFTQKRFLLFKDENPGVVDSRYRYYRPDTVWRFPFTFVTSDNPSEQTVVWITEETESVPVGNLSSTAWIKGNVGSRGVYRVNYDLENWRRLGKQLVTDHTVFSSEERKLMLDDVLSLARTGDVSYSEAFQMLRYLTFDDSHVVWNAVMTHLHYIQRRMLLEEEYPQMIAYIQNHLVLPKLRHLGWDIEGDFNTRKLKKLLISWARPKPSYYKKIASLYSAWRANDSVALDADLRQQVFNHGVRHGTTDDWVLIFSRAYDPNKGGDKRAMKLALASSSNIHLLHSLLHFSVFEDSTDLNSVLSTLGSTIGGQLVAWDFVRHHWSEVLSKMGSFFKTAFSFITSFEETIDDEEMERFMRKKDLGKTKNSFYECITRVKANVLWRMSRKQEVADWLRNTMRHWTTCNNPYHALPAGSVPVRVKATGRDSCTVQA
ncbi:hypothetical protein RRG08_020184 [Elysia crispata]|uniref:Aminopeptidase n=1 Tax=Elysia crispata TaxID=231223 RepID=A0AAE0YQP6_9GAST|nr:hypothetical protein RRG08_020184 [Elysia crispata]